MKTFWIVFLVVWLVCGFFAYGITYADFRGEFPSLSPHRHKEVAAIMALYGPFGLVVSFIGSHFAPHGLKWTD